MLRFAERTRGAKRSAIRELLKYTEQPEVISFAGGLPDPATFPLEFLARVAQEEILHNAVKSLQYTTTEGKRPLREALSRWLAEEGIHATMDQIVITNGAQQGLDLVGRVFLDPGDAVFVSLPDYLGALQAFRAYQPTLVGVPLEEDGMDLEFLRKAIREARRAGHTPKLIYTVPDFQNPTGIAWSEEKRRELLEIARAEDLLVVEDIPYRWLRYRGEPLPTLASLDEEGRVLVLLTFSKILAAGLRVGALVGPQDVVHMVVTLKQGADLCGASLTQRLVVRFLTEYDLKSHFAFLCRHYRAKLEAMLAALERYMPAEARWTRPEGGLFVWATLPEGVDTARMLERALAHKVAYVPGQPFFADGSGANTLRLSFALASPEEIEEGIRRLGTVVKEEIAALSLAQRS
ncbi:MAG: PLP-dependent aminotransferase family protein [Candidatus Bipolaricaulota bacterium]|nr:PLP-dependent aminotransferase family protein [Candidatus Bipolaricaulota bacterium]MDW8151345.1 PLP-dependent aminotransferase family protein [Candidatus Bipolaricaulota bacterium]